jgi:hypothetical protein
MTSRLHLERDTFLPVAWISEASQAGETLGEFVSEYDNEFVPVDSLALDFFDPASIGFVQEDLEAPLDDPTLDVTVYWLGREFAAIDSLPPLRLTTSESLRSLGGPGERAMLEYRTVDGAAAVRLQLWRPRDWEAFLDTDLGQLIWDSPCAEEKEMSLEDGRAAIFMTHEPEGPVQPEPPQPVAPPSPPTASTPGVTPIPSPELTLEPTQIATPIAPPTLVAVPSPTLVPPGECPAGPFDRFLAHVYFEDTVVAVNAPFCLICGQGFGPYDTLGGMEAVVEGLRPR